jgi:AbrB family looped-hinge helix DNA binding protein
MVVRIRMRETLMPGLRVGCRGQITIPSALRREPHLEQGDHVIVQLRARELILRPAGRSIFALRGSVPVDGPQDFAAIRVEVMGDRARRSTGDSD